MISKEAEQAAAALDAVRDRHPLVHNITNYVVMNNTANALLALGASPVMAHAVDEVEEMVQLAGALVLNIGTLSSAWVEAMTRAGQRAVRLGRPIVLDPVGAGATHLRTEASKLLLDEAPPSVVRGNASEIMALGGARGVVTRGVDSAHGVDEARAAADALAVANRTVVAVTGPVDYVTDGRRRAEIANGHALMGRVTGTGCMSSAITGAFCAVERDPFLAAVAALTVFGIAGELAAEGLPGPGTYAVRLIDALSSIDARQVLAMAKIRMGGAEA